VDVPPVLPSSWSNYLEDCLKEAFATWPTEDIHIARECVKNLQSENPTPPTPRQIRAIINRAAPIKKRWGTEMSTKAVFSYAFRRHFESRERLRQRLLTENNPSIRSQFAFDRDLLKEMSGILFGVTADRGPGIAAARANNSGFPK
jgi:hypothetical protein